MYKVFLTHSSKNMDMVLTLGSMLKSASVEVYPALFILFLAKFVQMQYQSGFAAFFSKKKF